MAQFATISEEELGSHMKGKYAISTQRVVKRSATSFRQFLYKETPDEDLNVEFENMSKKSLNEKLRKYFASLRTSGGGEVKTSTLVSYKYGLAKHLKESCSIDINTDPEFTSCRELFKAKLTDLKKKGRGSTEHKPVISPEDMKTLFKKDSAVFNTSRPCGFQWKVWFDIMFFLCRRGRENLRTMTKSTFAVETDATGMEYVYQQIDEADKNHRSDLSGNDTIGEARMYERVGDPTCPVSSYKEYISKLHPDIDVLWQRPLDSFVHEQTVWYCKSPVGKNGLSNMMSEISKCGKLSKVYTNHSIRATSITAMDEGGIEARHIMRASGHKSESSIRSYASRMSDSKKRDISSCLSATLNTPAVMDTIDKENKNLPVDNHVSSTGISEQELVDIFSNDENAFDEIMDFGNTGTFNPQVTPATVTADSGTVCVPTPSLDIANYSDHSQSLSVENTNMYSSFLPSMLRHSSFVINSNRNNSNVHFHFNGNPQ